LFNYAVLLQDKAVQYRCVSTVVLLLDKLLFCLQCESKKIPPLCFSDIFSQTVGNF